MFVALSHAGTMYFFSAVILIGLLWAWIFLPELSGMSLESINAVFELPWWRIGREGGKVGRLENEDTRPIDTEKEAVQTLERVG